MRKWFDCNLIETDKLDNTTTRKRIRFRYESTAVVAAVTVVVQYFSLPSHLPTAPLPPFVALHAARHFRFHRDRHGRVHRRNSELLTAKKRQLELHSCECWKVYRRSDENWETKYRNRKKCKHHVSFILDVSSREKCDYLLTSLFISCSPGRLETVVPCEPCVVAKRNCCPLWILRRSGRSSRVGPLAKAACSIWRCEKKRIANRRSDSRVSAVQNLAIME